MKYTTKMGYGREVEIIAENPEQIEDQLRNNGFNWYLKLMDFESPEPNTKLRIGQSIFNALGSEAVGIWKFNEGSGSTAYDESGYENDGSINGAIWTDGII